MKRLGLFLMTIAMTAFSSMQAQNVENSTLKNTEMPYKNSIGVSLQSLNGFAFKTFCTNHFAIQADLGTKFTIGASRDFDYTIEFVSTVEAAVNFMAEANLFKGLYGFIGGGTSLGYCWNLGNWASISDNYSGWVYYDFVKYGANALFGLEYKLNIPLTIQLDFRPGYGMLIDARHLVSYFDWAINAGVRYTF